MNEETDTLAGRPRRDRLPRNRQRERLLQMVREHDGACCQCSADGRDTSRHGSARAMTSSSRLGGAVVMVETGSGNERAAFTDVEVLGGEGMRVSVDRV